MIQIPTSRDLALGLADMRDGFLLKRVWWRLAKLASKEQHKRSILGPLWNTIGTLVMVLMFGLLYAKLLNQPASNHLPYVAAGLIIWLFYSSTIVASCTVFVSNTVFIQQKDSLFISSIVFKLN